MSIHSFESNRAEKLARDASMKQDAAQRRKGMAHKRKADCAHNLAARIKDWERFTAAKDCAHNRKAAIILAARIKDWERFTAAKDFLAPEGAFHKPGSMNRF